MSLAVSIRFEFLDAKNKTSFTKIRVPTGFTLAQYTDFAQQAAQLLTNASGAQITKVGICFNVSLIGLGLKTVANAVSSVAKKLALYFRTSATGFYAKTTIPAIDESLFVDGSDSADLAEEPIDDLIDMFVTGVDISGTVMTFTNDRQHDIVSLLEAKERFRRRRAS